MVARIIKFQEKYGDRYFDASTEQDVANACTAILRERSASGHYYYRNYEGELQLPTALQEAVEMTVEQVEALPETLQATVKSNRAKAAQMKQSWVAGKRQEDLWFSRLEEVLANPKDAPYVRRGGTGRGSETSLAYLLLVNRQGSEYEEFDIIDLESPDDED